ncbi:MAG: hypothetical protein HKN23_08885, partial [Verrucomicrobiales bacterium]|nr:hypothetical protein [Verrucomicrobiales bacterium]
MLEHSPWNNFAISNRLWILIPVAIGFSGCNKAPEISESDRETANRYLSALEENANLILAKGRDHYEEPSPLFVDGMEIETLEPVQWQYDHHRWILSNLANQQDLLRTLDGLTTLTGKQDYRDAAEAAVEFGFENLQTPNGLLLWGGHIAVDLETDQWVGRRFHWLGKKRSPVHELKSCYPHFDMMWRIDRKETERFVRVLWEAHIRDWSNLDFDRHGGVEKPKEIDERVWDREFDETSPVFFRGQGRTFVNCGSDLFYAASLLNLYGREKGAAAWAQRLLSRYEASRHSVTGLRSYHFSSPDPEDR